MIDRLKKILVIIFVIIIYSGFTYATDDKLISDIEDKVYDYYIDRTASIDKDVCIGDIVSFGRFYDMDEMEHIYRCDLEWQVLDKEDDKILLITKDIIKMLPYNTYLEPITWEDCSLRKWLNEDFYNVTFNDQDKEKIVTTENINSANDYYLNTSESNTTYDNVFLLSINECVKYYKKNIDTFKVVGTRFAIMEGLWISRKELTYGYSVWWLRTVGKKSSFASLIHAGGSIGRAGDGVATTGNGVRPCIWVKI